MESFGTRVGVDLFIARQGEGPSHREVCRATGLCSTVETVILIGVLESETQGGATVRQSRRDDRE